MSKKGEPDGYSFKNGQACYISTSTTK